VMKKAAGMILNGNPEPPKVVNVRPKDSTPPPEDEIPLPWDEGGQA
jgi:hypothetical protein